MSYHDDDFEEDSIEEDIPDEAPLDVQVTNPGESSSQQSLAGFPDIEIDYSYENEKFDGGSDCDDNDNLELHGRGERMKLSMKPPEVLLRLYQKQIENAKEKKKYDIVIEDLIRCTALARIVYGDTDWRFAQSESELAEAYWRLKGMAPQAQQHAEEARNIMLRVVQTGGAHDDKRHIYRVLLSVYITLGEAHTAQKKYTDAELSFQKAEKILGEQNKVKSNRMSGDEQEENIELKTNLRIAQGKLAANQGKSAPAIAYFEEAIELIIGEYGEDSIKLIPLYQLVGRVEQGREGAANHNKSIEAYLQAHSIANANYSENTVELAQTGYQLALAYTRTENPDAETSAESYLNECIATYQSVYGPNHSKTLQCQDELARLMIRTDRADEAIQLLRSTLGARKQTFGEHSDNIANTHKLLGSIYMSQGDMEKSLKSINKELTDAAAQYQQLQQQHALSLESALSEKDRQLAEGQAMFDQLKADFKYNLKLLQDRDDELQANDATIARLSDDVSRLLATSSEVSVRLKKAEERAMAMEEERATREHNLIARIERERADRDRVTRERESQWAEERREMETEKKSLQKSLQLCEEARERERRQAIDDLDEQLKARDKEWKCQLDKVECDLLAHQLRAASLTNETERLREEKLGQGQIVESSEVELKRVADELKKSHWELQDYRAMCNRRIQDLESQNATVVLAQKALVEKYERKLVQESARVQEIKERAENEETRHNDAVNELNRQVQRLMAQIAELESEKARLVWKAEDAETERVRVIEQKATERQKLEEKIVQLEKNDETLRLGEELARTQELLTRTKNDIASQKTDMEKYQSELAKAVEELSECERQKAKLELDCQRRCDGMEREHYVKYEALVSRLTKSRDEARATIQKLEKEAGYHQQAITALKKDRTDAYSTLRKHGLQVECKETELASSPESLGDVATLRKQNEALKAVITQMRQNMESMGQTASKQIPPLSDNNSLYVQSLEEEIKQLKAEFRTKVITGPVPTDEELLASIEKGNDSAVKEVIGKLNAEINALRTEKVQLTASARKQQIEIDRLTTGMRAASQVPRDVQIETEQLRYELGALRRLHDTEGRSQRQRIESLESQLAGSQAEAAEYHKSLLEANSANESLSVLLANARMEAGRAEGVINYGAQELIIQNQQDEITRLRGLLTRATPEMASSELDKANKKITQLTKEKAVLTELSNRLRADLLAVGMDPRKPGPSHSYPNPPPANKPPTSDLIKNKLDEIEKLQYDVTRKEIRKAAEIKENKQSIRPSSPPTKLPSRKQPGRAVTGRTLPAAVEHSSTTSDSSLKAKGKPSKLQARVGPSERYKAPPPNRKPLSNLGWHADRQRQEVNRMSDTVISEVTDSSLVGSSLQDVWNILDQEEPSMNTPR